MSVTAVRVPATSSGSGALEAWIDEAGNLVIPAVAMPRGNETVVVRHGGRLDSASLSVPRRGLLAIAAVSAFLIAVIAMFAVHGRQWPWTGFAGSTSLWSWLRLLVQPIAIAFLTVRLFIGAPLRVGRTVCLAGALLLALLILGGYFGRWSWTGFTGNTFRDWLDLMIAPFLIPLALKVVHILHVAHSASHRTAGPNDLIVKISAPR